MRVLSRGHTLITEGTSGAGQGRGLGQHYLTINVFVNEGSHEDFLQVSIKLKSTF